MLSWEDLLAERRAWDALIWFAPLLMMSDALNETGVIKLLSGRLFGLMTGWPWMLVLVALAVSYLYLHYGFASMTAHTTALYPGFLGAALAAGIPPLVAALPLAYLSSLNASLTHYGTGSAPVFFSAGYVSQRDWWRIGFLISVVDLVVWMGVGVCWWRSSGIGSGLAESLSTRRAGEASSICRDCRSLRDDGPGSRTNSMTRRAQLRLAVALVCPLLAAVLTFGQPATNIDPLTERDTAYERNAERAEGWLRDAVDAHPELTDDSAALLLAMGGTKTAYRNMAFVEGSRGNFSKFVEYLKIASELDSADADAALDYALATRTVDSTMYRKLTEAIPIRFPMTEQGAQAMYWLALDTPLVEEKILLLDKCRIAFPPARFRWSRAAMVHLFEAYSQLDLDTAANFAQDHLPYVDNLMYIRLLIGARDKLAQGSGLIAKRRLEDIENDGLPQGIDHTPYFQLRAATGAGYEYLLQAMLREPSDVLRSVLQRYGAKSEKSPLQLDLEFGEALRKQSTIAPAFSARDTNGNPVSLSDFRGR